MVFWAGYRRDVVSESQVKREVADKDHPFTADLSNKQFFCIGETMRILAAPNAFKGSLAAENAALAMEKGILAASSEIEVVRLPVADGGDSLLDILTPALGGTIFQVEVRGPLFTKHLARYCYVDELRLAIIEMAEASGLVLVPEDLRNPLNTTTYGTGELLAAALDQGAERIIVGIGGSATCDGGIGMAAALGYRFLDARGKEIPLTGGGLRSLAQIDADAVDPRLEKTILEVACDVNNPMFGQRGAAYVYGPQKGASNEQITILDQGLVHLSLLMKWQLGFDPSGLAGGGAAGGLGAGLKVFCKASLEKGIELVLDTLDFANQLKGIDLVITGEGKIDHQTCYDKAPAGVARAAKAAGVPCIAICGSLGHGLDDLHQLGLDAIFPITREPQTLAQAMDQAGELLSLATEQAVRLFLAAGTC